MATPEEEAKKLNDELKKTAGHVDNIRDESDFLIDAVTSIGASIQVAIEEAVSGLKNVDKISYKIQQTYSRDISRAIGKVTVGFDKQVLLQDKINKGIDIQNDIDKLKEVQSLNFELIKSRIILLSREGLIIEKESLLNLESQKAFEDDLIKSLENQNKKRNEGLGVLGKVAGGIDGILHNLDRSGSLSRFFNLDSALIDTVKQNKKIEKDTGKRVGSLENIKNLTGNIWKNVDKQALSLGAAAYLWNKALNLAKQYDTIIAETRRNLELNVEAARDLNIQLDRSTTFNPFKTSGITLKGMRGSIASINKGLGINVLYGKDIAEGAAIAATRLKLSEEAITGIARQAMISGMTFREISIDQANIVTNVEREYGIRLSVRDVEEEANKLTGQTLINTLRLPGGLAKAVAVAKSLGIEFGKIEGITRNLLDFESSITAELEAELLIGRDLNLERARALTLSGDQEGAMKELVAQAGSLEEIQKMNVLQQDALARALGMNSDQLAEMLMNQTAINSQIDESLDRRGEEALQNAEALSIQERIAEALENFNATMTKTLNMAMILGGIAALVLAIPTMGASLAGFGAILTGVAGVGAAGYGAAGMVSDGVATSDRGPFSITDSYGSTSITAKGDSLAVSPNLSIQQPQIQTIKEVIKESKEAKETNKLLKMILVKQGNVNINSTKIGTAFSMNSYEIQ